MTDAARVPLNADRYALLPVKIFLPIALVIGSLLIFDPGGLMGSPQIWLALLTFAASTLAWLVTALIVLFSRRWRSLLSMLFAAFLSIAALASSVVFADQICFQIMRPFYLHEIGSGNDAATKKWPWRGGLGWDVVLIYSPSDEVKEHTAQPHDNCTIWRHRMDRHFYLEGWVC
jgi:hypothetical protein